MRKVVYFCKAQMKKFTLIALIAIYALATMGFSLKHFYCCGNLKAISLTFTGNEDNTCSKSHNNNDDCCKNKLQYFKVKDTHVTASHINLLANSFVFLNFNHLSFDKIIESQKTVISYGSNSPPLHSGIPIYISNCIFRI